MVAIWGDKSRMLEIDGAYGEGGGQILRSALTLSVLTGRAIRLINLRARRKRPGLRPQHLTAVKAAAALCDAQIEGAALESQTLTFVPQTSPKPGSYLFDISRMSGTGSAGATTLILQTVLLPLAMASGDSQVRLRGGTVVPMSPPAPYLEHVYVPMLFELGLRVRLTHRVWGFYPIGGGELLAEVKGGVQLKGCELVERGPLQRVEGIAFAAHLPSHVPQRMTNRATGLLKGLGIDVHVEPRHVPSPGIGAGLFLYAHYAHTWAGFLSLGRRGLPSERVAEIACRAFFDFHRTGACAERHLADQLVLPLTVALGPSHVTVACVTSHLLTNVWLVNQFGIRDVWVEGVEGETGVLHVEG